MNGVYTAKAGFKEYLNDLKKPLVYSLALNFILVLMVPYFTFIRPRVSKKIYKIDFIRMPPPQKKKKEIIKKETPPPQLPDDTENVNKDAKEPPPPEEQAYEMEDLDDRPRIKLKVKPVYPENLRLAGIKGRVVVRFMINYYGYVEKVSIVEESPHEAFNEESVKAVKKWQFTPPKMNGKPASAWAVVPIRFKLEEFR